MIVGIVKESFPDEARVAMVPALLPQLAKAGIEVVIESDAGNAAGFLDEEYTAKGGKILSSRAEVFQTADVVAQVRALGAGVDVLVATPGRLLSECQCLCHPVFV